MRIALDAVLFATAWTHVLLAPYMKVEESFNLHATHDVLMYGVGGESLHEYDHFAFPGVVPRTFIGSILLAWLSRPVVLLASWFSLFTSKFHLQIIVRLVLASLNALTLALIRRSTSRRFGRTTGLFFSLLTCTQFHFPFWMGRTIPNMFATIPVNIATYLLVDLAPNATKPSDRHIFWAIALFTSTAVIFRAEILLLLVPLSLQLLHTRQISFDKLIKVGLISGLISLGLTVLVDSYFWSQFPLWPEFSGIYFNVIQGKSSEWGTSPRHKYLTSHLPKLLLSSLPLSLIGFLADQRRIGTLLLPSILFILIISNLGHKEWRFIVYIVPVFNIAGARGARWMVSRRKNVLLGRLAFLATWGLIAANVGFTAFSTTASMRNYPGGEALSTFHQLYPRTTSPPPHVHISNFAAQTGASLFLHLNSPPYYSNVHSNDAYDWSRNTEWRYNKTEDLPISDFLPSSSPFTHIISEFRPSFSSLNNREWQLIKTVKSFDRWSIDWELLRHGRRKGGKVDLVTRFDPREVMKFVESEKLWVLERPSQW